MLLIRPVCKLGPRGHGGTDARSNVKRVLLRVTARDLRLEADTTAAEAGTEWGGSIPSFAVNIEMSMS